MNTQDSSILKDFVFAADGNYILQIRVAVASIIHACRHRPRALSIHILDMGIGDADWSALCSTWTKMSSQAIIVRHPLNKDLFSNFKPWNGSVAPYARILLPSLLPDVKWCLYADGDTFFIDDPDSLSQSLDTSLSLVGHRNPSAISKVSDQPWFIKNGLPFDIDKYVCSGLLLMNLEKLRNEKIKEKALDFLSRHPDSVAADQSALNAVCHGSIGLLPDGWGTFMYETATCQNCKCVHFAGTAPWKTPTSWMFYCGEHRIVDLWYRFADRILGIKNLQKMYQPPRKCIAKKIMAKLLYPAFVTAAFLRTYPKSLADHAQAIRERVKCNAAASIESRLFA